MAAGAGVINRYAGGNPISRTAAVVAPGVLVMALIYAWGPLSGLHINPAVTLAFTGRRVFRAAWALPYIVAQLAGAILAALFLQVMFSHVAAGGNYPINKAGGEWRSFVMEIVLTTILVTVILNTATGYRSIGHNAALAVGATIALLGLFASPISGASMNPARTLGPDIVANDFTGWWVYVFGPAHRRHHRGDAHRSRSRTSRQGRARGSRRRSTATLELAHRAQGERDAGMFTRP